MTRLIHDSESFQQQQRIDIQEEVGTNFLCFMSIKLKDFSD